MSNAASIVEIDAQIGVGDILRRRIASTEVLMRRLLSLDCVLEHPHLPWRPTELGRQPPIYDIELDSPSLENAVNIGELARKLVRKGPERASRDGRRDGRRVPGH